MNIVVYIPASELMGKPWEEAFSRIHRYRDDIPWSCDYFVTSRDFSDLNKPYSESGVINDILIYTYHRGDGLYLHI